MRTAPLDLVGQTFRLLTVVGRDEGLGPRSESLWQCTCECGGRAIVTSTRLRNGHVKSCGCLKRRRGVENPGADRRPVLERLAEQSHTDLATGCRIWGGLRKEFGHGILNIAGKRALVHRAAWEAERGPIPDGLDCLHNCPGGDNPACWNVDHLWLGTQADNNADRDRKGRHVALKGERHGRAKVCDADIIAIRRDPRLNCVIGADYDISGGQVGRIKARKAWPHVGDELTAQNKFPAEAVR